MNDADGLTGASASPQKSAKVSRPTSRSQRAAGSSRRLRAVAWSLHALMFGVGLILLLTAHRLESLNSAMQAASGGGFWSTADQVRAVVHAKVRFAAVSALWISPLALLLSWSLGRWPRLDGVCHRWEERYRLAPPPGHWTSVQKVNLLVSGWMYGVFTAGAVVATAVAFHLVPGLYDSVRPTFGVAPGRALELIHRGESVAFYSVTAPFLVTLGAIGWRHRKRLRRMESWLDQGVAVCLACGYPLRGLNSPACPECGAAWSQWYPSKDGKPVLPS
jgi:hypothetical protein